MVMCLHQPSCLWLTADCNGPVFGLQEALEAGTDWQGSQLQSRQPVRAEQKHLVDFEQTPLLREKNVKNTLVKITLLLAA